MIALYNFPGSSPEDLAFKKGDVITIIHVTKVCRLPLALPFYAPQKGIWGIKFCPFCLSVSLWQKNCNLGHNFLFVGDRVFIFGMHTQLMKPFHQGQWPFTKVNDLVTLTMTFILKIANFDFVAAGGICVSQTHPLYFSFEKPLNVLSLKDPRVFICDSVHLFVSVILMHWILL